jgi:hypothetical protein
MTPYGCRTDGAAALTSGSVFASLTRKQCFCRKGWQGYAGDIQHIPLDIVCLGIILGTPLAHVVSMARVENLR